MEHPPDEPHTVIGTMLVRKTIDPMDGESAICMRFYNDGDPTPEFIRMDIGFLHELMSWVDNGCPNTV